MTQSDRAIRRAIRAGRAVEDPALAAWAAERAEHVARLNEAAVRRHRRFRWLLATTVAVVLLGSVLVLVGVVLDEDGFGVLNVVQIVSSVAMICALGAAPWVSRRAARRAHAAAEANRALAAAHPDVVQAEPHSPDSWFFRAGQDGSSSDGPGRDPREEAE